MRSTLLLAGALLAPLSAPSFAAGDEKPDLKRGAYLATVGGCGDCHTPLKMGPKGPEPDLSRQFAGHPAEMKMGPAPALGNGPWLWAGAATNTAFAGPWGITYAANLTADKETGLGNWKPEEFVKALKTGKHAGVGRPILPPMPWQNYSQMTDGDLRSLFAYLQSVPALKNRVPDYQPPAAPAAATTTSR
jgi:mono/diheme cytochrome c family protein